MNLIELLGTLASIVVAISLMMQNIRWLRWVNLVGAGMFASYGFMIQAWPVFGLNAFIVLINSYFLFKLASSVNLFSLIEVPVAEATSPKPNLLAKFLESYRPDIARFQPEFPRELPNDARVFFILRDVLPISLFVCQPDGKGNQRILIDYSVPAWRDYQNGKFLFQDGLRGLVWPGSGTFFSESRVRSHSKYLKRLGFTPVDKSERTWKWTLGDS